jgi:hypothetical protein
MKVAVVAGRWQFIMSTKKRDLKPLMFKKSFYINYFFIEAVVASLYKKILYRKKESPSRAYI